MTKQPRPTIQTILAICLALALAALSPAPSPAQLDTAVPEPISIVLANGLDLDEAGYDLRRALTAWENAAAGGTPDSWTVVDMAVQQSLTLDRDLFVVLSGIDGEMLRIMVVDDSGPRHVSLRAGEERTVGPLRLLAISASARAGSARVMLRGTEPRPRLAEPDRDRRSPTRILGFEDPDRVVVEAVSHSAADFSRAFLNRYNRTGSAEEAAQAAWEAAPPRSRLAAVPAPEERNPYLDSTNMFEQDVASAMPHTALVTLRVVRGEEESLRALSGSFAYDSAGTGNRDPRWTGTAGSDGGRVTVGSPGDRVQAQIRALEREGKVSVENESFVRVAVGTSSTFRFDGPRGGVTGRLTARQAGRQAVDLIIRQESGDWSHLGSVSTTGRFRSGQTRVLAQNTATRTTSSSSGPPIIGGIPWIGPMVGSSSSTRSASSYILIATVDLE